MSSEVTGLRKRLASFKPLNSSSPVSDLRVVHGEDGHGGEECGDEEIIPDEAFSENMSQSFSSLSSHSSRSAENEYEPADDGVDLSGRSFKTNVPAATSEEKPSQTSTQPTHAEVTHRNLPRVSTNLAQSSPRSQQRGGTSGFRDVKHTHDTVSSPKYTWLGYDPAIIIALVSPIGNLLTGSDHIKNILLLLLLIYYLHQLVEVPWTLYRMSIPSGEFLTSIPKDGNPAKRAAHAELRTLELFYLALTVLSPFLGATLLRYVATSILGNSVTLSWFSTSLFVLATGVRPWTHLTERLKDRSRALKALLEESNEDKDNSPDSDDRDAEIDGELSDLRGKFDSLDKRLTDFKGSSSHEWDDIADAIEAIEVTVRRYQAEAARKAQNCEARLVVLEAYVLDLHKKDRQARLHYNGPYMRGARLQTLFWDVVALPWTISAVVWAIACKSVRGILLGRTPSDGKGKLATHPQVAFHAPALETIVEEDLDF